MMSMISARTAVDLNKAVLYTLYEHVHIEVGSMPKIIENARELILETSEKLLFQAGYNGFTIRKVARRCGIAPGTIFNYFASKETLIAAIMAKDWADFLAEIKKECNLAKDIAAGVSAIYKGIESFSGKYESIWAGCSGSIIDQFRKHHVMLRQQIADILSNLLLRFANGKKALPVIHIFAETILASAVQKDIDLASLLQFTSLLFPQAAD